MEPNQRRVREFHQAFSVPAPECFTPLRDPELLKLRARLILEEALEFCAAAGLCPWIETDGLEPVVLEINEIHFETAAEPNDAEMIDAINDIHYVADGAAVVMGIDLEPFAKEVHASNMSKLDENGKPVMREDGKVLKSDRFRPPDIAGILEALK